MSNPNDAADRVASNVVILDVETTLDLPLERILEAARRAELSDCLVLGYADDGFWMFSTTVDAGKILVLIERARRLLVDRLVAADRDMCEG